MFDNEYGVKTARDLHDWGQRVHDIVLDLIQSAPYGAFFQQGVTKGEETDIHASALWGALMAALELAKEMNVEGRLGYPIGERMPYQGGDAA